MNAAERRIVHKVSGEDSRVETHSEGEGRDRHVVITYVGDGDDSYNEEEDDGGLEEEKPIIDESEQE